MGRNPSRYVEPGYYYTVTTRSGKMHPAPLFTKMRHAMQYLEEHPKFEYVAIVRVYVSICKLLDVKNNEL